MSDTLILVDLPNRVSRPPFRPGCRQRQGQNGPEAGKGVFVTGFQATVFLTWVPNDDDLDGNLLARNLASEACWDSPPNGLDRVQSAAYQKDRARTKAFLEWERDYHYDRMMEKFLRSGTGPVSGMHTSMPSLYHPPPLITASGKRPSKWKQMTEDTNDQSTTTSRLYNWQSTMPSQAPTLPGFAHRSPPAHTRSHAGRSSVILITSYTSFDCSINLASTLLSTRPTTLSHSGSYITFTPTVSYS